MFNPKISFIPEAVCMQEYKRVVPYLKDTLLARPEHVNVGTIGHVDHGRTVLSACISGTLGTHRKTDERPFTPFDPNYRDPVIFHASELENVREIVSNGSHLTLVRFAPKK